MNPRAWQFVGVGLLVLMLGMMVLWGNSPAFNWDLFEGVAWGVVACYIVVGFILRSRASAPKAQEAGESSKREAVPVSQPLIDPWPGVDLCKQGRMEYRHIIELCEDQMSRGDGSSAACLAWLCEYGPPEVRDRSRARALYRKAALLGHEAAFDRVITDERLDAQHAVMTEEQRTAQMGSILDKVGAAVAEVKRGRAST